MAAVPTTVEVEIDVVIRSVRFAGQPPSPTVEDLTQAMAHADSESWPLSATQHNHYQSYALRVLQQLRAIQQLHENRGDGR